MIACPRNQLSHYFSRTAVPLQGNGQSTRGVSASSIQSSRRQILLQLGHLANKPVLGPQFPRPVGMKMPRAAPDVDNRRARSMNDANDEPRPMAFTAAEVGALAHLYRGELYRSTVWRTR